MGSGGIFRKRFPTSWELLRAVIAGRTSWGVIATQNFVGDFGAAVIDVILVILILHRLVSGAHLFICCIKSV